jgi:YfiR/HmsC-like
MYLAAEILKQIQKLNHLRMKNKITVGISLLWFMGIHPIFSQTNIAKEQSKFIYIFTREIEWPLDYRKGDFNIQVYGSNQLYAELRTYMIDKTVTGQHIIVKQAANIEGVGHCHVLIVGQDKASEMQAIKRKVSNGKTLLITDKSEGIRDGACISFILLSEKLNYEISPDNIVKMGLKYSADLVDLAVDSPLANH